MKFLHLSDLHIGKNVNGFSMMNEQRHVFEQIIKYIRSEHPEAVVIAGDVYDRAVPNIEAVRIFDDFLTELADLDVAVMLISGNHDSPERLNYASRILSGKKIFMYGTFNGNLGKIVLSDEYGDVNFWLLPFVKPSSVYGMFDDREIESYGDVLEAVIETADIDYTERNVLVAHQFFTKTGVAPIRSESEINPVGGLDAIDCRMLENFDYVALGHLHGAQKVGAEHIRYAGSPVKYSFSEWRQEKSVTVVELNEKGNINLTAVPIQPIHDMREIRGKIGELTAFQSQEDKTDKIDKTDKDDRSREDYLRVILTDEDEIIDPMGKIRSVYPNVMSLDFENSRSSIDLSEIIPDSEKIEKLSLYDLFSEFFLDVNGSVMSEEQGKIVGEILDSVMGSMGSGTEKGDV